MPIALIFFAVLFITVGLNGCYKSLFSLFKDDFTGQNNFFIWVAAILMIGIIGYIPKMKEISQAFLVLIFVSIALSHRGFLDPNSGFIAQIKQATGA